MLFDDDDPSSSPVASPPGGGGQLPGSGGTIPPGGCVPGVYYKAGHPCAGAGAAGPCPPGQTRHPTRGDCRYTGDYPCPTGLCKDVATGQCRSFNPNREKVNETDTTERDTGGGRGYCKQRSGGGGGGGGGGGAGGGASAPSGGGFGISPPTGRFNDLFSLTDPNFKTIWDSLLATARGDATRYNPQTMGYLEGQARVDRAGNVEAGTRDVEESAIARGMGRSGATTRGIAEVANAANTTYARTVTEMRVKKVEQDFEDRMGALDRMRAALNERQQYILGLDTNAADREKAIANIALGYARIAAEERMLRERLRADLQIANNSNMTNILLNAQPV